MLEKLQTTVKSKESWLLPWNVNEDHSHKGLQLLQASKLDRNQPGKYIRPGRKNLVTGAKIINVQKEERPKSGEKEKKKDSAM